jgi:hypothetical protein
VNRGPTKVKNARVPGALRRLLRDRSRLVAVVLLAIVALSASGIQSAAAVILQRTLDSNWRGAYDILVTANDNPAGQGGLLAPNSLAAGDKGMSLADVAAIRTLDGIAVAAPIGEVDISQLTFGYPSIALPEGTVDASTQPQAFRITSTYTTNDGLGPRYVTSKSSNVIIDETPKPVTPVTSCSINDIAVDTVKYPSLCRTSAFTPYQSIVTVQDGSGGWGTGETVSDGVIYFGLYSDPQGSTRVTLVDPVAERKLLGVGADFLKQLEALTPDATTSEADMTKWASSATGSYATDYLDQQSAVTGSRVSFADTDYGKEIAAFAKEHGFDPDGDQGQPAVYVPLLTANAGVAPLTLTTTVQALGPAPRTGTDASLPYQVPAVPGTPVGTSSTDASALLNPFAVAPVDVAWPGTSPAPRERDPLHTSLGIRYPGIVAGSKYSVDKTKVTLTAPGFAQAIPPQTQEIVDPFVLTKDGSAAGVESVYSPTTLIPQPHNGELLSIAVPVGSFSTAQLSNLQSKLSYVPLGAYQSIGATVDSDGTKTKLNASVTGLGIVSPRTIAIASIASAPAWHQDRPVTAVRVRVAGITTYTPESQQKVISVAQAIQDLGFSATIVAGSSPTAVDLTVTNYAFGVADANGVQKVGTLGQITQQWSELGAAGRADLAVSTASLSVLGIALGSTALLLGAVQFASVPRRRGQAAVMREIGWTSGRIRRWMAAEEIPGIVIVLLAGLAAVFLSGLGRVSINIAAIGVAAVAVSSAAAVVLGSRGRARVRGIRRERILGGRRALRIRGRTTTTFGLRQARIHLLTSITQVVAVLIVAVSAAGLAEVFLEGRQQAGASLLAQFTTGQAAVSQLVLAAVALAAGIILALLARRVDLARRASQWTAMRAMGWTSGDLLRAQRIEAIAVSAPAIVLAVAATWGGSLLVEAPALPALVTVGGIAAVMASLSLMFVRRKATPQ